MKKSSLLIFTIILVLTTIGVGQTVKDTTGYTFTDIKEVKYTSVKNQHRSGTCWSFSGLAFLEAELLRTKNKEYDFSEMFIVRHSYSDKATKYVRFQGTLNFAGGGSFYDVIETIRKQGIVPEQAYPGLSYSEDMHVHGELDAVTRAYVDAVVKNPNKKLTTAWKNGFEGILDAYLGKNPTNFSFEGKSYTPETFLNSLGLNLDEYVYLSSFTHQPFYKKFIIEVPDNWAFGEVYNIPLDEFMQTFDFAIENGYTVAWASDVSEKGFAYKHGLAVVPEVNISEMTDSEKSKWTELSQKEKDEMLYKFSKPGKEKSITQELRQAAFDNLTTTDDHGMLIVGISKDQNGNKYYKVKNSWGASDKYKGFFYASEPYVRYKTLSILVHKNAIPKPIAKKLGL
jgi:bleomycin hydrolase